MATAKTSDEGLRDLLPDSRWRAAFRRRLRSWYAENARDLPWRRTRDPYAIWVSETMLQQTQVATVIPYFHRFMERFPTVVALADADEAEVLRHWEGLGYYRRARQLHAAAKVIAQSYDGQFPNNAGSARGLPGVGRYTAGAILSIAFDQREPILEANTLRLFSRVLAFDGDLKRAASQRLLWEMAEIVLPRKDVGLFNQALMELGGQVCDVRTPQCSACPVKSLCRARIEGRQHEIPRKAERKKIETRHEAAVIVRRGADVLLVRYAEGARWAGLWDFPRTEIPLANDGSAVLDAEAVSGELLAGAVHERTGVRITEPAPVTRMRHAVTRYAITLDCFEAHVVSAKKTPCTAKHPSLDAVEWVRIDDLHSYPLSTTGRKLTRWAETQ